VGAFFMPKKGVNKCPRNRSDRVPTPDVRALQMGAFARNTPRRRHNATSATTAILLCADDTAVHGSAYVTLMYRATRCVKCVKAKDASSVPKRCIIKNLSQKAAHTRVIISSLFAKRVTPESTQNAVIAGTTVNPGRGVKISVSFHRNNGRGVSCAKSRFQTGY